MEKSGSVALIIPMYNESKNIYKVIEELPDSIGRVIIINDGSTDNSREKVLQCLSNKQIKPYLFSEVDITDDYFKNDPAVKYNCKYFLLNHQRNKGKGAAVKSGYKFALILGAKCIATIDADGQMNSQELEKVCYPILTNEAGYVKGNRLAHPEALSIIPKTRLFGIFILTYLTRVCSGYYHINDSQTGFTAIHADSLRKIDIDGLYDYYGYVNDILVKLSVHKEIVREVPITPIYHDMIDSKMNIPLVIPKISLLLVRLFIWKISLRLQSVESSGM